MVNLAIRISLSISASNLVQSARNSAHSSARSAVNSASSRAASGSARPAAVNSVTSPSPRCASATVRAIPSANTGASGTAHTPWPNKTAPARRSSRQTATRCRDGSAGTRTTSTNHRAASAITLWNVAPVTLPSVPCWLRHGNASRSPTSPATDVPHAPRPSSKAAPMISYLQAIVIGLLQGVTELFPVSSLGHSVLVPAFIGGSWEALVTQSATSTSETSPYLAVIVALHVATAVALIIFFRSDWVRIIRGFLRTIRPSIAARRLVTTDADERLACLLIIATIPVGITGLALEHTFRTLFAKPLAAAIFLTINGLILLAGEALRRRAPTDTDLPDAMVDAEQTPGLQLVTDPPPVNGSASPAVESGAAPATRRLATLHYGEAAIIGSFQ